jgi:hypothetical protein
MMLVYLQAWNLRCCEALGELLASMARPTLFLACCSWPDGAVFGLQLTQPPAALQRCIFVDLLLSYNVVTLAVTSLY